MHASYKRHYKYRGTKKLEVDEVISQINPRKTKISRKLPN